MTAMRWIITEDAIDNGRMAGRAEPVEGVRQFVHRDDIESIAAAMPTQFRLLDDDGEVYFMGSTNDIDKNAEHAFAPLDWAQRYGCTTMEYRANGASSWTVL